MNWPGRRRLSQAFEGFEIRIDEIRGDCGDRVLVLGRQRGTVRGAPFDQVLAEVYEIEAVELSE